MLCKRMLHKGMLIIDMDENSFIHMRATHEGFTRVRTGAASCLQFMATDADMQCVAYSADKVALVSIWVPSTSSWSGQKLGATDVCGEHFACVQNGFDAEGCPHQHIVHPCTYYPDFIAPCCMVSRIAKWDAACAL